MLIYINCPFEINIYVEKVIYMINIKDPFLVVLATPVVTMVNNRNMFA